MRRWQGDEEMRMVLQKCSLQWGGDIENVEMMLPIDNDNDDVEMIRQKKHSSCCC